MSKKIKICISDKLRPNLHKLFHEYLDSKFDNINRYYDDLSYGYGNDIYGTVFPYDDGHDAYIQFWEEEERKQELREKRRKDALKSHNKSSNNLEDEYVDDDAYIQLWEEEARKHAKRRKDALKSHNRSSKLSDDEYVDVEEYDGKGRKKKHRHNKSKSKSRSSGLGIHVPYSGYEENPDEVYESYHVVWYYPNYNDKDDRLEFDSLKDFDDFCMDEGILVPPYMFQELINHSVSHVCLNPICMERGIKELIVSGTYNDLLFNVYDLSEYDDEGICSRHKI